MATCFTQAETINWTDTLTAGHSERALREYQLVEAAQAGDSGAFNELCRFHRPMILRVAQRVTGNWEDAQDAVQDALLSAYIGLPKFNGRSRFQTWLTRIVINSSLMILRRRRGLPDHRESVVPNDFACDMVDTTLDPEKALLQTERARVVRDSIQALPPKLRVAAEVGRMEERSVHETAAILGVSIGAAKARLARANSALKRSSTLRKISRTQ